jgi:hypothetical protein
VADGGEPDGGSPDGGVPPPPDSTSSGSTATVSTATYPSSTLPVTVAISVAARSSLNTLSMARVIWLRLVTLWAYPSVA